MRASGKHWKSGILLAPRSAVARICDTSKRCLRFEPLAQHHRVRACRRRCEHSPFCGRRGGRAWLARVVVLCSLMSTAMAMTGVTVTQPVGEPTYQCGVSVRSCKEGSLTVDIPDPFPVAWGSASGTVDLHIHSLASVDTIPGADLRGRRVYCRRALPPCFEAQFTDCDAADVLVHESIAVEAKCGEVVAVPTRGFMTAGSDALFRAQRAAKNPRVQRDGVCYVLLCVLAMATVMAGLVACCFSRTRPNVCANRRRTSTVWGCGDL